MHVFCGKRSERPPHDPVRNFSPHVKYLATAKDVGYRVITLLALYASLPKEEERRPAARRPSAQAESGPTVLSPPIPIRRPNHASEMVVHVWEGRKWEGRKRRYTAVGQRFSSVTTTLDTFGADTVYSKTSRPPTASSDRADVPPASAVGQVALSAA